MDVDMSGDNSTTPMIFVNGKGWRRQFPPPLGDLIRPRIADLPNLFAETRQDIAEKRFEARMLGRKALFTNKSGWV